MPDIRNELARRKAVGAMKRRIGVTRQIYIGGKMSARVLIDNVYFDVTERELNALQKGVPPADLEIDPSADQSD